MRWFKWKGANSGLSISLKYLYIIYLSYTLPLNSFFVFFVCPLIKIVCPKVILLIFSCSRHMSYLKWHATFYVTSYFLTHNLNSEVKIKKINLKLEYNLSKLYKGTNSLASASSKTHYNSDHLTLRTSGGSNPLCFEDQVLSY